MRMSRIATTLFGAALLFSTAAFAGETNKGNLRLSDKVTVNGTSVEPGEYKVEWSGNGPDVQVTLLQGSRTVATFPARVAEQPSASAINAYAKADQPDGNKTLTAIYFSGKRQALQVEGSTQSSNANPGK